MRNRACNVCRCLTRSSIVPTRRMVDPHRRWLMTSVADSTVTRLKINNFCTVCEKMAELLDNPISFYRVCTMTHSYRTFWLQQVTYCTTYTYCVSANFCEVLLSQVNMKRQNNNMRKITFWRKVTIIIVNIIVKLNSHTFSQNYVTKIFCIVKNSTFTVYGF